MRIQRFLGDAVCGLSTQAILTALALAQAPFLISEEEQLVSAARFVLNENAAAPERAIPRAMLSSASGIAIIPNLLKGGFVLGVRHGRGVVLLRDAQGAWSSPQFVTLTGGSIGWQAGIQSTDLILVFKTPSSVRGLLSGKITIGADLAAAAGPIGRNAAAATDAQLKAEIYSYSRSRGLFAGVALDGSSLQIDHAAAARYYQAAGLQAGNAPLASAPLPASASALVQEVTLLTQVAMAAPPPAPFAISGQAPTAGLEPVRQQLIAAAAQLQNFLDPNWRNYLALPAEATVQAPIHDLTGVEQSLMRFDTVASDPRYAAISSRVEFQTTHQLLRQFLATARQSLTAPPSTSR